MAPSERSNPMVHVVAFLVTAILVSPTLLSAAQQPATTAVSDVLFIGANPNLTLLHPGFSPAHLRALLDKIAPAAVCVELRPDWPRNEGIPTYPQEQYAVLTWAERKGIPIHGVDWDTPARRALPPIERMSDATGLLEHGGRFERFRESRNVADIWNAAQAFGEASNEIESFQRSNLRVTVDRWPEEDTTGSERYDRIAENVRAVLAKYPGQRVAIIFSSGHYLPLKRRLESTGQVRVVPPLQYFPLEPERINGAWHPDDAVLLLGINLDDWRSVALPQSRDHHRTKEMLERLTNERSDAVVTLYYEARWRMLFGDLSASRAALQRVVDVGGTTMLPYMADARWSWPPFRTFEQKARFYLAVAHDLAGHHDAATSEYRRLLSLPQDQLIVPAFIGARRVDLRPYLESLMRTPYRGGLFEAYRSYLAMGR